METYKNEVNEVDWFQKKVKDAFCIMNRDIQASFSHVHHFISVSGLYGDNY